MNDEDFEMVKKQSSFTSMNLENMSINEIEQYISKLELEIIRCKEDIKKKKSHMEAASAFFK